MINLKIVGAAALLAIAPVMVSSADAAGWGGRGGGGGGGFSRGGGGGMGGGAFRGGGGGGGFRGGGFAARPSFGGGGPRVGNFAGRSGFAAAVASPSFAGRAGIGGQRWANNGQRWNGNRGWRGRGYGYGFAGGLALGALGSSYYYGNPGYYDDSYAYAPDTYVGDEQYVTSGGDDAASCAARFRSYDPRSGTYLAYDGNRYACP